MKKGPKKSHPGLTLLGNAQASWPSSPSASTLETFASPNASRDYRIRIDCPDFTSLCPVTGQPDFARITLEYIPGKVCLETKSLKLYLSSFRDEPSFNEEIVNRILDDLTQACSPRWMRVEGAFAARGGISLTVIAEHPSGKAGKSV